MSYNNGFLMCRLVMATKSERLEARVIPEIKQLVDRVTALSGLSIGDYISGLILSDAPDTIQKHSSITLSNDDFDRFIELSKKTVKPSKKLVAVAKELDESGF